MALVAKAGLCVERSRTSPSGSSQVVASTTRTCRRTSSIRSALVGPVTTLHGDLALTNLAAAVVSASHRYCASNSSPQIHSLHLLTASSCNR
eukprot:6467850-Amphidinium_carterae.1